MLSNLSGRGMRCRNSNGICRICCWLRHCDFPSAFLFRRYVQSRSHRLARAYLAAHPRCILFPRLGGVHSGNPFISGGDRFTDCYSLGEGLKPDEDAVTRGIIAARPASESRHACEDLKIAADSAESAEWVQYARYWHGYRVYSAPLALAAPILALKLLNLALSSPQPRRYSSCTGSKADRFEPCPFTLRPRSLLSFHSIWFVTPHTVSTSVILLGSAFFALAIRTNATEPTLILIAAVCGSVFNFVDFLVNPPWQPMLLAFFLGRIGPGVLRRCSCASLLGLAPDAFTWASKWMFAAAVYPSFSLRADVLDTMFISEFSERTPRSGAFGSPPPSEFSQLATELGDNYHDPSFDLSADQIRPRFSAGMASADPYSLVRSCPVTTARYTPSLFRAALLRRRCRSRRCGDRPSDNPDDIVAGNCRRQFVDRLLVFVEVTATTPAASVPLAETLAVPVPPAVAIGLPPPATLALPAAVTTLPALPETATAIPAAFADGIPRRNLIYCKIESCAPPLAPKVLPSGVRVTDVRMVPVVSNCAETRPRLLASRRR